MIGASRKISPTFTDRLAFVEFLNFGFFGIDFSGFLHAKNLAKKINFWVNFSESVSKLDFCLPFPLKLEFYLVFTINSQF
jgi:hypothetical protein